MRDPRVSGLELSFKSRKKAILKLFCNDLRNYLKAKLKPYQNLY